MPQVCKLPIFRQILRDVKDISFTLHISLHLALLVLYSILLIRSSTSAQLIHPPNTFLYLSVLHSSPSFAPFLNPKPVSKSSVVLAPTHTVEQTQDVSCIQQEDIAVASSLNSYHSDTVVLTLTQVILHTGCHSISGTQIFQADWGLPAAAYTSRSDSCHCFGGIHTARCVWTRGFL